MFSKAPRALLGLLALVSLPALMLAGCGEEEVDPYVYGTLDQVRDGEVRSENFLFEVTKPEFIYVEGSTGFAKSGNRIEVIVGDDLENRVPSWTDSTRIGIQKLFSPYVWFMAKRVNVGMETTVLDSVENPLLPHVKSVNIEEVNGYDIGQLRYNQKQKIEDMAGAEVQTVGTLHYLPDHEAEQPEEPAEGEEPAEPEMAWYLRAESSDATFKITNVTEQLELAFHLLENEGLPFIGGVIIGEPYTWASRRETRVSAPVQITYVQYANRYLGPGEGAVERAEEEEAAAR